MLLFAAERKDAGCLTRSYFPVVTGDSFLFCPCLTAIFANLLQPPFFSPCSFIVLSSTSASRLSSFLLSLLSTELLCVLSAPHPLSALPPV